MQLKHLLRNVSKETVTIVVNPATKRRIVSSAKRNKEMVTVGEVIGSTKVKIKS